MDMEMEIDFHLDDGNGKLEEEEEEEFVFTDDEEDANIGRNDDLSLDDRGWDQKQQEQERRKIKWTMMVIWMVSIGNRKRHSKEEKTYEVESDDNQSFACGGHDEDAGHEFLVPSGGGDDHGSHNMAYVDGKAGQITKAMILKKDMGEIMMNLKENLRKGR